MIHWLNAHPVAAGVVFFGAALVVAVVLVIWSPEDWY